MPTGIQAKGLARESKMIHAGIQLFLKNGYSNTSTTAIAKAAGMSPASFFAAFDTKEALPLKLVQRMFDAQFSAAAYITASDGEPLFLYAAETALQLHIAEYSDAVRELYVTAYSLPSTARFIYGAMTPYLMKIFGSYLPGASDADFRELEIASSGIMRGFMAEPCSPDFPMERKLRRYLDCCMTLYNVPPENRRATADYAVSQNMQSAARQIVEETIRQAEDSFHAAVKASDEYRARRTRRK